MKKLFVLLVTAAAVCSLAGCSVLSGLLGGESGPGYPEDGYAEGYLGDAMHTAFFDFTINSAYTCTEFDGLTPSDGFKFLVADITIKNTTPSTQPMFVFDFQVQWDAQPGEDEDQNYDFPLHQEVTSDTQETDYVSVSEQQLPASWELGISEERTGTLLYEVPAGAKDYSISFLEMYESEDSEDSETGDVFFVFFNAEEK